MLEEYEDICITTEAELPLELFGVKSYAPISFSKHSELENYLDEVLSQTRFNSWGLASNRISELCQPAGFPLSGPQLVKILLEVYCETHKPNAKIVLYKACPLMPWHLPESIKYFSPVHLLHIIRDPRAVYHSQSNSFNPYTGKPYSTSPLRTALDWQAAARVSDMLGSEDLIEIKYEDLIHSPDATMRSILTDIGLEGARKSECHNSFVDRMDSRDQQLHKEVMQNPDPKKNSSWENHLSSRDLAIIETVLADQMSQKAYACIGNPNEPAKLFYLYLKLALLLEGVWKNMRRARRILKILVSNPAYLRHRFNLKVRHD